MGLTVLTGGPNAGTTSVAYEALREAVREGRSARLLLPTIPDVRRAQRALAAECPVGLGVGQLDRAIEAEWAVRGDGRRPVASVERSALLSIAWGRVARDRVPGEGLLRLLGMLARRSAETGSTVSCRQGSGTARQLVRAVLEYRTLLEEAGLVEPGEAARLLARCTAAPADLVVVQRFMDIGPSQRSVLLSWARHAEVLVSLPFDPAVPATAVTEGLIARFRAAGARVRACPDGAPAGEELGPIAARLFGTGRRLACTGAVSLGLAQGPEAEARLAAHHVELALADGAAPERIAVAFRDPSRHYSWLRRAFQDRGIPADYDVSVPAGETPMGRAILLAWAFAAGERTRAELMAFLRSPYAGTPAHVADAADTALRASRAPSGLALLDALPRHCAGRSLLLRMVDLAATPVDDVAAKKWQVWLDALLANGCPDDASSLGEPALTDAAVHGALLKAVEALSRIDGATPAQAVAALRETSVSQSRAERPGHVQVMSIERLRSRRFDVVVLGGMNASEFPRPGVGDALEGAAVQDAMRALGVVHDQAEEAARERLLFLLAVTRPRRALTLLRQETDDEGEALRRSVFWDELLDVYRDPTDPMDERGPVLERLLFDQLAHDATRLAGVRSSRGVISDPQVTGDIAASLGTVAASDIEAYLECPYAWFVGRVLRPGGGSVDVDLRLRGHVAHDALARFHRGLAEATGRKRVTPESLPCALEVASRSVARALEAAPKARCLEERRVLGSVERAVLGLVKRDATFLPSYEPAELEWAFGRHDDGIDLGGFLLAGRVDRIDTGPEGLMIIDYKSSAATPVARFTKEGKIQLQLYAVAASTALGLPVAGALYRSLATSSDRGFVLPGVMAPGIVRTDRRSAAEIDELLGAAVDTARAAVEAMRAGEIAPRPDERRCARCGSAGFCAEARR